MYKGNWTFSEIWNGGLAAARRERPAEKRNHLWASEIGQSYSDIYNRLQGIEPTNPPNQRSLRKFDAGNYWEWIVGFILNRAGLLKSSQDHISYQYPDLMKVTGRLDYIAGGLPDFEKARKEMLGLHFPEQIESSMVKMIDLFSEKYSDGVPEIILEIKSCSSYMFERYLETKEPSEHHAMQIFHYLKGTGMDEGHIIYICKDDCMMEEFILHRNDVNIEKKYKDWITTMTKFVKEGIEPPKEPLLTINNGKFTTNWKVAYSEYLTKTYGYALPHEYEDVYRPKVARWNRVLKRIQDKAEMTKNNLEVIEEAKKEGYNLEQLI